MDSIVLANLADLVWKLLVLHAIIGALFTRVPYLSKMYVMAAYEHAKAAKAVFELSELDPVSKANGVVRIRETMAKNAIIMANKVIDYCETRSEHLVHTQWMSEILWTFGFRLQTWGFEFERKKMLIRANK